MAEKTIVHKTNREAVIHIFYTQVLGQTVPKKIKEDQKLIDCVPKEHKAFAADMVQVYIDRIARHFSVLSKAMANKTIGDILNSLEHSKAQAVKYGGRPIKRSQYRR